MSNYILFTDITGLSKQAENLAETLRIRIRHVHCRFLGIDRLGLLNYPMLTKDFQRWHGWDALAKLEELAASENSTKLADNSNSK